MEMRENAAKQSTVKSKYGGSLSSGTPFMS